MPSTRVLSLQLQEASYQYPHSSKIALSQVSYTFARGATAIVGPNGAGKSTLVKLLTGLLAPTSGQIRVRLPDGTTVSPEKLHKAVLFQEPSHLYLTIRQNITMRFEKTPGEDERIHAALDKAGLSKVVKGLSDGIDTLVGAGFGGQTDLSGGQWQRLALARLLYQDAPVIILDEPVASLDPQGERAVFELFAHMARSRIIIFTTHRYDSIPNNTKIVVLVDGVISESGTHEELLQKQRDYWTLYMSEASMKTVPALASQSGPSGGSNHASNGHDRHRVATVPVVPQTVVPSGAGDDVIPQFAIDANDGQDVEMLEAEMNEGDAFDGQIITIDPPATSPAPSMTPASPSSLSKKSAPRWKKSLVLVSVCLALLLLIAGLGTAFVLHARENGSTPSMSQKHVAQVVSSSNASPTQIPGASLYPALVASYAGTVADLMTKEKTPLHLTDIQQNLGSIQGFFQGLGLAGIFNGTVTPSGQIQFMVTLYADKQSLLFEGTIKVGGDMVGTFAVLNQQGRPSGETGLWNMAASS